MMTLIQEGFVKQVTHHQTECQALFVDRLWIDVLIQQAAGPYTTIT